MFEIKYLKEKLLELPINTRLLFLACLCGHSLKVVKKYFRISSNRCYVDTVVGMTHTVDIILPSRALSLIKSNSGNPSLDSLNQMRNEYNEPIVALQDGDLEIDDEAVIFGYYAIYNLILYALNPEDEKQMMLMVNQAFSSYMPKFDGSPEQKEELKKTIYKCWHEIKG